MDVSELISRYRGPLVGFLSSLGNDPRSAGELAQDTVAQAYLARESFRGQWSNGAQVGPWLLGIARRLHLAQRRQRRFIELVGEAATPEPNAVGHSEQAVANIVNSLSAEWREVLSMRYSGQHSLLEISELLGITPRAVEGRLRRARKELEARLVERGIVLGAQTERSSP